MLGQGERIPQRTTCGGVKNGPELKDRKGAGLDLVGEGQSYLPLGDEKTVTRMAACPRDTLTSVFTLGLKAEQRGSCLAQRGRELWGLHEKRRDIGEESRSRGRCPRGRQKGGMPQIETRKRRERAC